MPNQEIAFLDKPRITAYLLGVYYDIVSYKCNQLFRIQNANE